MTGVYAIVAFFGGIFLCGAAAFCWFILKTIKELKASVDLQVKATQELLGEGSFTRISKSLSSLSGAMPDMLGGIKEFADVMRLVFKANRGEEPSDSGVGVRQPHGSQPPVDHDSAFYPGKTDLQAALDEVQQEAARQRLPFTPEEAARAHTDEAT